MDEPGTATGREVGCKSHSGGGVAVERKSNPRPQRNGSEPESTERAALEALVEAVVGAAYEVSNVLGAGFLEKPYERALIEKLRLRGIPVAAQATFPVAFKGKHIGTYAADLVVDGRLLVQAECVARGHQPHDHSDGYAHSTHAGLAPMTATFRVIRSKPGI